MSVKFDSHGSTAPACHEWRDAIRACLIEDPLAAMDVDLQEHLSECPACRQYHADLASALTGLDSLRSRSVQPSPAFRNRWRSAVLESNPAGVVVSFNKLTESLKWLLWNNRRPAFALAIIWMLTLLFMLASPEPRPVQTGATAWTPVQVVRFFAAEKALIAQH